MNRRPKFPIIRQERRILGGLAWLTGKKIAFLGDSITADMRANYVTLVVDAIAKEIDATSLTVINSGVDSSSILDALDRLPDVLLEHDPDVVVLFVGVNDSKIFRRINRPLLEPSVFEESYLTFLRALDTHRQRDKILVTPPPLCFEDIEHGDLLAEYWYWNPKSYREYSRVILRAGRRKRCVVADLSRLFAQTKTARRRLFHNDGVHPNIYGHRIIADAILTALGRLGQRANRGLRRNA